jgi:hypothetical protein
MVLKPMAVSNSTHAVPEAGELRTVSRTTSRRALGAPVALFSANRMSDPFCATKARTEIPQRQSPPILRYAILSVRSTGATGSEAPRVHDRNVLAGQAHGAYLPEYCLVSPSKKIGCAGRWADILPGEPHRRASFHKLKGHNVAATRQWADARGLENSPQSAGRYLLLAATNCYPG